MQIELSVHGGGHSRMAVTEQEDAITPEIKISAAVGGIDPWSLRTDFSHPAENAAQHSTGGAVMGAAQLG
jgi:hypothetical protein